MLGVVDGRTLYVLIPRNAGLAAQPSQTAAAAAAIKTAAYAHGRGDICGSIDFAPDSVASDRPCRTIVQFDYGD
jgi:hypothetical protein